LERSSKTDQGFEPDGESVSPNKDSAEEMRIDPLRTKRNVKLMTACAESGEREDLPATASDDDDAPHVACSALGKLRLPRSLLEKWVEEPFFEKAVVGCFVRLGVGKAPGARGEPQYKVCEIISVDEYKHAYPFGEFETRKALMLRIGRNQRLWRMSVISNHRFTDAELQEWQSIMRTERQKIPSVIEINRRKAQMRKAVFGVRSGPQRTDLDRDEVQEMASLSNDVHWVVASESTAAYSEMDVAKIVDARRKRNEAVTITA
jgi:RNA polymerase-associated protein RTF1